MCFPLLWDKTDAITDNTNNNAWSCLVEASVFKPLQSNLRASLGSVFLSKHCFKTESPCSKAFLYDTRGTQNCGAFCCLFLLVKHSLSGPVQQSGRACAMPSRTFLADTSCLQAAFLCAHTHYALRFSEAWMKNNTDIYHTCENGKDNTSAHGGCQYWKTNDVLRD